jgi:acetyl-CoA synthetase
MEAAASPVHVAQGTTASTRCSSSTPRAPPGKPKGIFHTTGGYLTQAAYTNAVVHDVHPETDVYWCTADIGWVTGHSYIVYGPLANGATQVHVRGHAGHPAPGPVVGDHREVQGDDPLHRPDGHPDLHEVGRRHPREVRPVLAAVLGSVGEPINPEAWMWYRKSSAATRPIVDTWWQTETGGIMISPLPGVTTLKPGSAQRPIPGIGAEVVDDEGEPVTGRARRLPRAHQAVAGDAARHLGRPGALQVETYWSRFGPKYYFAGDGAK